jgi:hypothetical protein
VGGKAAHTHPKEPPFYSSPNSRYLETKYWKNNEEIIR